MRSLVLVIFFIFSFGLQAVCFSELDGEVYGCERLPAGDSWCRKNEGKDLLAFRTTNTCSEALSYELRNKTYKQKASDLSATVEAACMTYEDGEKLGCEYYDFFKAENYCAEKYGHRYIPFVITKTCSLSKASSLRGEVSASKLLSNNLRSAMDEIDKLITMVDKESTTLFKASRPVLKGEFYTNTMKAIMAKMNMVKETLYKNSKLNVPMVYNKYVDEFLKESFRYLSFMARVYKLYAYVAHQNHFVLKTYDYNNLAYLNLKLKKDWGLELLSKANFEVKTVDGGKSIEFSIGEQEKQTYEFMAMEDPRDITDYAKSVTFLGVRENLTNLWAVERLSTKAVPNDTIRSCGKDFLSFRPKNGSMQNSDAMKDLWSYDVFYNDYVSRWDSLVDASRKVSILNGSEATFMYNILVGVPKLKEFLLAQEGIETTADIKAIASSDAPILKYAEDESWNQFSNDHFPTIVLPGDSVLQKNKVIERIAEDAFSHRVDAMVNSIIGIYVWLDNATIKKIETTIRSKIEAYRSSFNARFKTALSSVLTSYAEKNKLATKNRQEKLNETYDIASRAAHAAYLLKKLDVKKPSLNGLPILDPNGPEELMMIFQSKISKSYFDLKYALETNKTYAALAHDFFQDISDTFFNQVADRKTNTLKFTETKRREILRSVAFEVAKKFLKKYPMQLSSFQYGNERYYERPNVIVADNTRVVRPIVQTPIFSNGKPAPVRTNVVANLFDRTPPTPKFDDYRVAVDNTRVVMGINPIVNDFGKKPLLPKTDNSRRNPDKVTTGEISKPVVVTEKGEIKSSGKVEGIYNSDLLKLYANSNIVSKKVKAKADSMSSNKLSLKNIKLSGSDSINSKEALLSRILQALNFKFITVSSTHLDPYFITDVETQMELVQNHVGQAYQGAPLLRNDFTWKHSAKKLVYNYKFDKMVESYETKNFTEPLLIKIALDAFNPTTKTVNKTQTISFINQAINSSELNAANKLSTFCNANYLNYKTDAKFKDVYTASGFLRATLKDPTGVDPEVHKRIEKFDAQITKDIRSKWQAINEDYLDPALMILGTIAIISVAIVSIIGTGGAAAPGVIGLAYAGLSAFVTIEFYVSFPLVVGSLYARLNTHFIEVPSQLKFQRSLALSQVDAAKIVDWDMLKASEKENKNSKIWTIGLMPLDFLYGYSILGQARKATGLKAIAAYRRQTGMKLRGFSAPPKSMLIKREFSELRKKHGVWRATLEKSKDIAQNVRMVQPRYTALPAAMIEGVPLRMGISRQAEKLGISNKPWELLKEMVDYRDTLRSRISVFETYSKEEARILREVKLNGKLNLKEITTFGLKYSKAGYIPKSLREAYKNGTILDYFKNYNEAIDGLRKIQGKLVEERSESITNLIDKMMDFKKVKTLNNGTSANLMDEFLGLLNTQEIMAMEEMAKWSKGSLREFKSVFKDYKTIVDGLRPHTYLYGTRGAAFTTNPKYPSNALMGEDVDPSYAFKNNKEDIVEFYESMMVQNGFSGEKFEAIRSEIELELTRNYGLSH